MSCPARRGSWISTPRSGAAAINATAGLFRRVARFVHAFFERRRERFRLERFRGTFAPERRACESPMAIACFLLLTFLPERPLFSVPRLRSCIARLTLLWAFRPYLRRLLDRLVAMVKARKQKSCRGCAFLDVMAALARCWIEMLILRGLGPNWLAIITD
jgi:hypothetical protein